VAHKNGSWTRIGENKLGFGVERFEGPANKSLWRLSITRDPNDALIEIDARESDLRAIKRFCDEAINIIETDGGRTGDKAPRAMAEPAAA
jgi:hypothetical protein